MNSVEVLLSESEHNLYKQFNETTKRQKLKYALYNNYENIRTLCIISPENPMGKSYTEEKNSKLRAEFNKYCNDNKFITHKVEGKYGGDETSYMIPNIILSDSIKIAEKFNQESFIYSYRDDNDKFVFCYYEKNSSNEYVCLKTKTRIINQNDADDYFTKLNNFKFQIPFFENLSVLKNELDERYKNKDDVKYRIDRSLDESLTNGSRWRARGMLFVKDYEPPTNAPKQ